MRFEPVVQAGGASTLVRAVCAVEFVVTPELGRDAPGPGVVAHEAGEPAEAAFVVSPAEDLDAVDKRVLDRAVGGLNGDIIAVTNRDVKHLDGDTAPTDLCANVVLVHDLLVVYLHPKLPHPAERPALEGAGASVGKVQQHTVGARAMRRDDVQDWGPRLLLVPLGEINGPIRGGGDALRQVCQLP